MKKIFSRKIGKEIPKPPLKTDTSEEDLYESVEPDTETNVEDLNQCDDNNLDWSENEFDTDEDIYQNKDELKHVNALPENEVQPPLPPRARGPNVPLKIPMLSGTKPRSSAPPPVPEYKKLPLIHLASVSSDDDSYEPMDELTGELSNIKESQANVEESDEDCESYEEIETNKISIKSRMQSVPLAQGIDKSTSSRKFSLPAIFPSQSPNTLASKRPLPLPPTAMSSINEKSDDVYVYTDNSKNDSFTCKPNKSNIFNKITSSLKSNKKPLITSHVSEYEDDTCTYELDEGATNKLACNMECEEVYEIDTPVNVSVPSTIKRAILPTSRPLPTTPVNFIQSKSDKEVAVIRISPNLSAISTPPLTKRNQNQPLQTFPKKGIINQEKKTLEIEETYEIENMPSSKEVPVKIDSSDSKPNNEILKNKTRNIAQPYTMVSITKSMNKDTHPVTPVLQIQGKPIPQIPSNQLNPSKNFPVKQPIPNPAKGSNCSFLSKQLQNSNLDYSATKLPSEKTDNKNGDQNDEPKEETIPINGTVLSEMKNKLKKINDGKVSIAVMPEKTYCSTNSNNKSDNKSTDAIKPKAVSIKKDFSNKNQNAVKLVTPSSDLVSQLRKELDTVNKSTFDSSSINSNPNSKILEPIGKSISKSLITPKTDNDEDMEWFFSGILTRTDAENKVKQMGQNGAFLIRKSQRGGDKTPYSLTIYQNSRFYNLQIRQRSDGKLAIGSEKAAETVFNNLTDLVTFHQKNSLEILGDQSGKLFLTCFPPK